MNSRDLLIAAALAGLLGYLLFLPGSPVGPLGQAIGSFEATATVVNITFVNGTAAGIPVTNGDPLNGSVNLTYQGAGVVDVTVTKPAGYEDGYGWLINESGTVKNVTDLGENLRWSADLDLGGAILLFSLPPPVLVIESTAVLAESYERRVMISSERHFEDVHAVVAVSVEFGEYGLFLLPNMTDVTDEYALQVADGVASWQGFGLSTKRFLLAGSREADSRAGGAGRYLLPLPEEASVGPLFVSPELVELRLVAGGDETPITIRNVGDVPLELRIATTAAWLRPSMTSLLLAPGEEQGILVTVDPPIGHWEGRLIVSDGERETYVFFDVEVVPSPAVAPPPVPEAQLPSPLLVERSDPGRAIDPLLAAALILVIVAATAGYALFGRRGAER